LELSPAEFGIWGRRGCRSIREEKIDSTPKIISKRKRGKKRNKKKIERRRRGET